VYFDQELKKELGTSLCVGVPGFTDAFFGAVPNLQSTSQAVFEALPISIACTSAFPNLLAEQISRRATPHPAAEP